MVVAALRKVMDRWRRVGRVEVPIYDWILPNGKFGKSSGKTSTVALDGKSTAFGLEIALT
jgi:hypothetical protein